MNNNLNNNDANKVGIPPIEPIPTTTSNQPNSQQSSTPPSGPTPIIPTIINNQPTTQQNTPMPQTNPINSNQVNSLGNFFEAVGQTMLVIGSQEQLLENNKSNYNSK